MIRTPHSIVPISPISEAFADVGKTRMGKAGTLIVAGHMAIVCTANWL